MYKLYSMQRSGNSYKVRLALALLDAPYRAIEIDILRGESRTPDFLAMNPSGQVPLLEVAEGRYLAESNAILWYVAVGTSLAVYPAAGLPESALANGARLVVMNAEPTPFDDVAAIVVRERLGTVLPAIVEALPDPTRLGISDP